MKKFLLSVGFLALSYSNSGAQTNSLWVLQCSPGSCIASDGSTQAAGTIVGGPLIWNGTANWSPPAGQIAIPYTGQIVYAPVAPVATTMPFPQFLGLLTVAQRKGLWGIMVNDTGFADLWWQWIADVGSNGGMVDTSHPTLAALLTYCVGKSYLTQAQMNLLMALQ